MNSADIREDEKVVLWLGQFKSERTKNNYASALREYCKFVKKNPTSLIDEAKKDIKSGKLMDERRIFEEIERYVMHLNSTKGAPNTKKLKIAGITSFFKHYYIEVPRTKLDERTEPLKENIKIPTREDIQDALAVSDLLERALILVGVSSGLSAEDICNLKVEDFKNGYDPETGITSLQLQRQKTKVHFMTYLTPEASEAVWDYIEKHRNRRVPDTHKDRLKQIEKQRVHRDDGYLFVLRRVPPEYLNSRDEELRKISPHQLIEIYNRISEKTKEASKNGWALIRSHNMRKYFSVSLKNARVIDIDFIETMMGHKLSKVKCAYYPSAYRKYAQLYAACVPYLTIRKENVITENPEFKRLNEEMQRLKGENEKLKLDRFENEALKQLKEDMEGLKKAKQKQEAARKEFQAVFEEEERQNEAVKKATNLDFHEAVEYFDVGKMVEPDSKELEEHYKRLGKDMEYRKRYREATSSKVERQEQELGKKALKTLADSL